MVLDALKSLVLFAPKKEVTEEIHKTAETCLSKYGYEINFLEIIKTGRKLWIGAYITPAEDILRMDEMKAARKEMTDILEKKYDSIYIYITPEIEEGTELPKKDEKKGKRRLPVYSE